MRIQATESEGPPDLRPPGAHLWRTHPTATREWPGRRCRDRPRRGGARLERMKATRFAPFATIDRGEAPAAPSSIAARGRLLGWLIRDDHDRAFNQARTSFHEARRSASRNPPSGPVRPPPRRRGTPGLRPVDVETWTPKARQRRKSAGSD